MLCNTAYYLMMHFFRKLCNTTNHEPLYPAAFGNDCPFLIQKYKVCLLSPFDLFRFAIYTQWYRAHNFSFYFLITKKENESLIKSVPVILSWFVPVTKLFCLMAWMCHCDDDRFRSMTLALYEIISISLHHITCEILINVVKTCLEQTIQIPQ